MIRRSTLVVIVLFIIAVAALLVFQKMPTNPLKPTATPAATSMPTLITGWQTQEVTGLTLKRSDASAIVLTKNSDNTWTRAQMGSLTQGKVEQILSEILAVRMMTQLPTGQNLADLGLQSPVASIEISGNSRKAIIQIGAVTATQSGFYVKVDEGQAVIVDKGAVDTILQLFGDAVPATPTPPASPTVTAPPS
jgi:hypothetical protein